MYSGTCILIDSLQNIFLYTCQYILFYMNIMTPQIHIEKVHKCSYAYACYLTCSFNTAALFPWAIYALYYVLCFHLRNITVVYLFTFLFFENPFINKNKSLTYRLCGIYSMYKEKLRIYFINSLLRTCVLL